MTKAPAAYLPGDPRALVRPLVSRLQAYVPGEQPKIAGLIKLNTNENPYPPSPHVLETVKAAVDGRLRLYPSPAADRLRERLARFHNFSPDNIIVGNGSDELLALAVRTFVEPRTSPSQRALSRGKVQFFTPSYSLYPVLADMHCAARNPLELRDDFSLPALESLKSGRRWDAEAALTFLTTPNAPSGCGYKTADLEARCRAQQRVVVLDEAYADFASENALRLALEMPHVLVARTFSKAYSLCFLRVGYCVGDVDLISAMHKMRDSYNVNGLGQVAAEATLEDLPWYRTHWKRILASRQALSEGLAALGFEVVPSQANFIYCRPPRFTAEDWLGRLREAKILVRWFDQSGLREYLRITVGADPEVAALLKAAKSILAAKA